jgi:hypothetical protein
MPRRRRRSPRALRDVKDRLIQARVPERLESVLKEEAQKRRLSVSHLIRNMLEDTLNLVDTVVAGAEDLVEGSATLAGQVARDASKIASTAREAVRTAAAAAPADAAPGKPEPPAEAAPPPPQPPPAAANLAALDHVLAWNQVVVHRATRCASCACDLPRGTTAHLGMSQDPTAPPAWLCAACLAKI